MAGIMSRLFFCRLLIYLVGKLGELVMNFCPPAVSQDRVNFPSGICVKGFNFGTFRYESFEAVIATVDGEGFEKLVRILERALKAYS